jgi:DNA adenine methylase
MTAPFPYFGGKSAVESRVWSALGNPRHYIEPFFGSGAVLLARKNHDPANSVETVCDKDGHLANVWRALKFSPDATSEWADWPVNHADLSARKRFLNDNQGALLASLIKDDEWHDAKMAGYWIWAASAWIGSGMTRLNAIPHISNAGRGVHAIGQVPHVSNAGRGVGMFRNENIFTMFHALSKRLRFVRVVCGDWTRVCGGNWQDKLGPVGLFFDPPYGVENRDTSVYANDSTSVSHDVSAWAVERGANPNYRICIAGYIEEHEWLKDHGWTVERWSAKGGYSNLAKGNENRHREALFFSPHCINKGLDYDRPC